MDRLPWLALVAALLAVGCSQATLRRFEKEADWQLRERAARDNDQEAVQELFRRLAISNPPGTTPDPYLDAAFAQDPLRGKHSRTHRALVAIPFWWYRVALKLDDGVGMAGLGPWCFDEVADLLRDPDPRVRSHASWKLAEVDPRRSIPYMIGMLTDRGSWISTYISDWNPGMPIATNAAARATLERLLPAGEDGGRIPLDLAGTPQAQERSWQRYYAVHAPLLKVEGTKPPYSIRRQWLSLAELTGTPVSTLVDEVRDQPQRLPDRIGASLHTNGPQYYRDQPIDVWVTLRILGPRKRRVVDDATDGTAHVLRLYRADGTELPRLPCDRGCRDPKRWGDRVLNEQHSMITDGLEWNDRDQATFYYPISKLFAVREPGDYVLRYEYREPGEPAVELRIWDGRDFTNEYRFRVVPAVRPQFPESLKKLN